MPRDHFAGSCRIRHREAGASTAVRWRHTARTVITGFEGVTCRNRGEGVTDRRGTTNWTQGGRQTTSTITSPGSGAPVSPGSYESLTGEGQCANA
eukprot:7387351-Prymnesium_polylepis.1